MPIQLTDDKSALAVLAATIELELQVQTRCRRVSTLFYIFWRRKRN